MDEIWQRHKAFIVQVAVGAIVLIIALVVKSNMYSGADDPEEMKRRNEASHAKLQEALDKDEAPDRQSIENQQQNAERAVKQIRELAGKVASLQRGEAYVRENIEWLMQTIDKPTQVDRFYARYQDLPQAALSSLREEVRTVLIGRAAELGKEIDEDLGLSGGYEDDEVVIGIHGLAIVADLVKRCLELEGIESVSDISIRTQSGRGGRRGSQELSFIRSFPVRITVEGDPSDVTALMHSFNRMQNTAGRLTVVEKLDYLGRLRPDVATVKATYSLFGLQHLGLGDEDEQEGDK